MSRWRQSPIRPRFWPFWTEAGSTAPGAIRRTALPFRHQNKRLREGPASVHTSLMQHEVFANTEDFGGPDIVAGPSRICRPGMDAPYANYNLGKPYDEMFTRDGKARPPYAALDSRLSTLQLEELNRRQQACEQSFLHQGITFTVYNDNKATERIIPTDLLPRIVTAKEWDRIERGLTQRILALNLFLRDIYNDGRVLKDGVVPRSMIYRLQALSPRDARASGAAWRLCQYLRQRSDPQRSRRFRRAGRQSARAVGRQLHAGQSRCGAPRLSGGVPFHGRAPDRALSAGAAGDLAFADAVPRRRLHRGADAGRLQQRLFRTRLPGAPDGRGAGGRPRPAGQRQCRLYPHHLGPEAHRRHLSPHRRRFHRSADLPRRFLAGRAGPVQRLSRRQCDDRQCAGHRRGRRQGGLCLCAAADPLLSGGRADPGKCRDLSLPRGKIASAM